MYVVDKTVQTTTIPGAAIHSTLFGPFDLAMPRFRSDALFVAMHAILLTRLSCMNVYRIVFVYRHQQRLKTRYTLLCYTFLSVNDDDIRNQSALYVIAHS